MIKGYRDVNSYEIIHEPGLRMGLPWSYVRKGDGSRFYLLLLNSNEVYGVPIPVGFQFKHDDEIDLHSNWKDNVPDENGG